MTQLANKLMYFRALDKKSREVEIHRGSILNNQSSLSTNESLLFNMHF